MADLAFRAAVSAADLTGSANTLVITKPTGTVQNDLIDATFITYAAAPANPTHTLPSGFSVAVSGTFTLFGGAYNGRVTRAYKVAGGSEGSSYTFTASANCFMGGHLATFDNVLVANPFDVASSVSTFSGTASLTAPSVTTTTANALITGVANSDGTSGATVTYTSSALTERADANSIWHGSTIQASAGASGTKAITASLSGRGFTVTVAYNSEVTHALLADDVQSTSNVTAPAIGQVHAILANDVQSTSNVSVPALGQIHALTATSVQSASEVTEPAIALVTPLLADDVESASEVSTPSLGQIHALAADDVQSTSNVTSPAIGQIHALAADDVESASELTEPVLSTVGEHALLANDVESASSVSVPVLTQVHALTATSVQSTSSVSNPAIGAPRATYRPVGGLAMLPNAPLEGDREPEPEPFQEPQDEPILPPAYTARARAENVADAARIARTEQAKAKRDAAIRARRAQLRAELKSMAKAEIRILARQEVIRTVKRVL